MADTVTRRTIVPEHAQEVADRERFEFGKNWQQFLSVLNNERIAESVQSLKDMLGVEDLRGKTFLDLGSGSGLSSLSARRLGAYVHSIDFDPQAVTCTNQLKHRYLPHDTNWKIEEGSVLDQTFMKSLAKFDIVYSWGVLHHTGAMWQAIDNAQLAVAEGGQLCIAIYNNQGKWSVYWTWVKKTYNRLPYSLKIPFMLLMWAPLEIRTLLFSLLTLRPQRYIQLWSQYYKRRGMSRWYDIIDWIGGYPFEVAKPEEVLDFTRKKGFVLEYLKTCGGGHGNNQYVFRRIN
jgi:2-polyprenyl-6-hydroxyphenyl methylase/3-demethylubiquinone-9 3-methyltransferase